MTRITLTRADLTEENANGDPQYTHILNDDSSLIIVLEHDDAPWLSVQRECNEEDYDNGVYAQSNGTIATHDCPDFRALNMLLNTVYAGLWE